MIRGFALLLVCQLAGEITSRGLALPVPGPVLGLAILVVGLGLWNRRARRSDAELVESEVGRASTALLQNLALLFVPAGVGVIQYLGLVAQHGFALALAIGVSTVAALLATVATFLLVKRWVSAASRAEEAP